MRGFLPQSKCQICPYDLNNKTTCMAKNAILLIASVCTNYVLCNHLIVPFFLFFVCRTFKCIYLESEPSEFSSMEKCFKNYETNSINMFVISMTRGNLFFFVLYLSSQIKLTYAIPPSFIEFVHRN